MLTEFEQDELVNYELPYYITSIDIIIRKYVLDDDVKSDLRELQDRIRQYLI